MEQRAADPLLVLNRRTDTKSVKKLKEEAVRRRKKLSKRASKSMFKKNSGTKRLNYSAGAMRGGYRL